MSLVIRVMLYINGSKSSGQEIINEGRSFPLLYGIYQF